MAKIANSVTVGGFIAPSDTADTYPTHISKFGKGGFMTVADETERLAIPADRREVGMEVKQASDGKKYTLTGGIANTNWVEVTTNAVADTSYMVVADTTERDSIESTQRKKGMEVKVLSGTPNNTKYELRYGTGNKDWGIDKKFFDSDSVETAISTVTKTDSRISRIEHKIGNDVIRQDDYMYTDNNIYERKSCFITNEEKLINYDKANLTETATSISRISCPIAFRDTSMQYNSRSNSASVATTKVHLSPQIACHDIIFTYGNYYINASSQTVSNTNSITVKAALEVNGVKRPAYFGGSRTVTIAPGELVSSDPIDGEVLPTDTVFIRTWYDAGTGGYVPYNINLSVVNGASDGITKGSDLVDSGTITDTAYDFGFCPISVTGVPKQEKCFLVSGDSIAFGVGDSIEASKGNMGYISRKLFADKIGSVKIAIPGETAQIFLNTLYPRLYLVGSCTHAVCNYGCNDLFGIKATLKETKNRLLQIWAILASKGLRVAQTTITPNTTSTDSWLTTANQTVKAEEANRVALNAWLLDTSANGAMAQSAGNLKKVIDLSFCESNGKWVTWSAAYTGTVVSATTNSVVLAADSPFAMQELDTSAVVKITAGTGAGQSRQVSNNGYGARNVYLKAVWSTIPDSTSTIEVYKVPTQDGTHPAQEITKLIASTISLDY